MSNESPPSKETPATNPNCICHGNHADRHASPDYCSCPPVSESPRDPPKQEVPDLRTAAQRTRDRVRLDLPADHPEQSASTPIQERGLNTVPAYETMRIEPAPVTASDIGEMLDRLESAAVQVTKGGIRMDWNEAAKKYDASRSEILNAFTRLLAENARLTEWKSSVLNSLESKPDFVAGEWAGDKRGWGYVFEYINWMHRELERLRKDTLTATADSDLLVELCALRSAKLPRDASLADMAADGWREAVRQLILPVATRLQSRLRSLSLKTEPTK